MIPLPQLLQTGHDGTASACAPVLQGTEASQAQADEPTADELHPPANGRASDQDDMNLDSDAAPSADQVLCGRVVLVESSCTPATSSSKLMEHFTFICRATSRLTLHLFCSRTTTQPMAA